jgi:RNA polymerase sigma-70 factor (ECF subfamily)
MHVLVKGLLERAQPEKGRLRSLLLASLTNFVANQRNHLCAVKRGGARTVSSEVGDAEARYLLEPLDEVTPERIYERQWAAALLARVLAQLRAEFVRAGKEQAFDVLKAALTSEKSDAVYRHAGEALNVSAGAARVAAHRLRRRYRELLRVEIGRTVHGPEQDIDDEIKYLFSVMQHRAGQGASTLALRP